MKLAKKIIGVSMCLCILLFLGTCYFQNCRDGSTSVNIPQTKYTVIVRMELAGGKVNRAAYYSDDVKVSGPTKEQIVTMNGYWEYVKDRYVFKDAIVPLSEKLFGDIEVKVNGTDIQ